MSRLGALRRRRSATWVGLQALEPRLLLDAVTTAPDVASLSAVHLSRLVDVGSSIDPIRHEFSFSFVVPPDSGLLNANLYTPLETSFPVSLELTDAQLGQHWAYRFSSFEGADLESYPAGPYLLELDFGDVEPLLTSFFFGDEVTGQPFPPPSQTPEILTPFDGAPDVPLGTAFQWAAVVDPKVNAVAFQLREPTLLLPLADELLHDVQTTSLGPFPLAPDTDYLANVAFIAERVQSNEHGVPYVVSQARATSIGFHTALGETDANPTLLENVQHVFLHQGVVQPGDDAPDHFIYALGFYVDPDAGLVAARFHTPTQASFDLFPTPQGLPDQPLPHDQYPGELWAAPIDSLEPLADFTTGAYWLELDFGDAGFVNTAFDFLNVIETIEAPAFVTPLDGAVVDPDDVLFTWNAPGGANVDGTRFLLRQESATQNVHVAFIDDPLDTSVGPLSLETNQTYKASIAFANVIAGVNSDGVSYETVALGESVIAFTTAELGPDLVATFGSPVFDNPLLPGGGGVVPIHVRNLGNAAAVGTIQVDLFVRPAGANPAGEPIAVGGIASTIAIAPTDEVVVNVLLNLPSDLPPGTYDVLTVVDAGDAIVELNEDNNLATLPAAMLVTEPAPDEPGEPDEPEEPDPVITEPDFTVGFGAVSFGSGVLPGATGTVELLIINTDATFTGDLLLRVFLSQDHQLDANDVLLGSTTANATFDAATVATVVNLLVPADTAPGGYRLIAVVDADNAVAESDETNNTVVSSATLTVAPAFVDLTAQFNPSDIFLPSAGNANLAPGMLPGGAGVARLTLRNLGNVAATGPLLIRLYASEDATFDDADTLIGALDAPLSLAAGGNAERQVPVLIPTNLDPGTYRVIAVIDAAGHFAETNEANNLVTAPGLMRVDEPFIDLLTLITVVDMPIVVPQGAPGAVQITLINTGTLPAVANIDVGVYLSSDQRLGEDAVLLATLANVPINLARLQPRVLTANFVIPPQLDPGTYYLIAAADTGNVVPEWSETNNIAWSYQPIAVTPPPDEDPEPDVPSSALVGKALSITDDAGVTARVKLRGSGQAQLIHSDAGIDLLLTGVNERTRVSVKTKDGFAFRNVTIDGGLKSFNAKNADLTGAFNAAGVVRKLRLDDLRPGAQLSLGPAANPKTKTTLRFDQILDADIRSQTPIAELTAKHWLETNGQIDLLAKKVTK